VTDHLTRTEQSTLNVSTHDRLMDLLRRRSVEYRVMEHAAMGETRRASEIRSHPIEYAAKSLVLCVCGEDEWDIIGYVLAVVCGHRTVDLPAVAVLNGGRFAYLAETYVAERLTGCVSGSIAPFSFDPCLSVVIDPELLDQPELVFNAGLLNKSLFISPQDYVAVAEPAVARIAV
jgi:Ala-tRNA(Pro) deacylase